MKYRMERAIILAAGIGERMHPVTLQTPKPLIRVHGIRLIDRMIHCLHQNGICEIWLVVGCQKEQFASLETEHPGIRLIEDPWYDRCNNIASLYCARQHLENAIILDGDQLIYDPSILSPEFERSGYNVVWTARPSAVCWPAVRSVCCCWIPGTVTGPSAAFTRRAHRMPC